MRRDFLYIVLFLLLIFTGCSLDSSQPDDGTDNPPDIGENGYKLSNPVPYDSSIIQTRNVQLHWTADGNPASYKILFDTSPQPVHVLINSTESVFIHKSRLQENQIYYWQVIATYRDSSEVTSPIWSFTVGNIIPTGYTLEKHGSEEYAPSNVSVLLQVFDLDDVGITNFDVNNFELFEDGESIHNLESVVQVLRPATIPFTLNTVIMIDNSSSIDPNELTLLKNAALEFVGYGLEPGQTIELYEFSESINQLSAPTPDLAQIQSLINGISPGAPSTDLYGATIEGVKKWVDVFDSVTAYRGILIIFTDGNDTQASHTLNETMAAVEGKQVIMVSYDYTNEVDLNILKQLSTVDFFYTTEMNSLKEYMTESSVRLQTYVNSFYRLIYTSPIRGNSTHELKIRVKDNPYLGLGSFITAEYSSREFN